MPHKTLIMILPINIGIVLSVILNGSFNWMETFCLVTESFELPPSNKLSYPIKQPTLSCVHYIFKRM